MTKPGENYYLPFGLVAAGCILLGAAAAFSGERIEQALVSDPARSLEWGPALLRVLLAIHGLILILAAFLRRRNALAAFSSPPIARPLFGRISRQTLVLTTALGSLFVAAAALRLWRLDSGLWLDEILTATRYTQLPLAHILTIYDSQNQHMLFTLLARLAIEVFGESAWALRFPAVLFGVLSIWALYLFAREVSAKGEALLAAALMTVSYHHVWFSQNARGYTGLLCFTLLSSWLLVRGLREARPALWILYAVMGALGMWVHLTMLFVLASHFLIYLWKLLRIEKVDWPGRWQPLLLGFPLLALFTLELYALVLPQVLGGVLTENHAEASNVALWKNPLWSAMEVIRGLHLGLTTVVGVIGAILVFGVGLISYARDKAVVLLLLFAPLSIAAITVIATRHPIWPRLFFFTLGFVLLIVVRGAFRLGEMLAPRKGMAGACGVVVCLALVMLSVASLRSVYGPKQDFQAALRYVEESRRPGDTVVTIGVATIPYIQYYKMPWHTAETVRELNALREPAQHTWVLYTIPLHLQTESAELKTKVDEEFDLVKSFEGTLAGGTVYVTRSRD